LKDRLLTTLATTTEQRSEPDKETPLSPRYVQHFKITFSTALAAVPAEDWCRTWAADRTIMLRMTSKSVKEVVDKMSLPVVVRLRRSFWDEARHGTAAEILQFVMNQLTALTAQCHISTLELPRCEACCGNFASTPASLALQRQQCCLCNARLAGVMAKCPALAHLHLTFNAITCGKKRKMCDIATKIMAAIVTVDAIMVRIRAVKEPEETHLLPGLLREMEIAASLW
jgi:hypothetical protein